VSNIENADFGSLGLKKKGTVTITPPGGQGLWLTKAESDEAAQKWGWKRGDEWSFWDEGRGGCVWAGHGL
jgi:hypothetical protein